EHLTGKWAAFASGELQVTHTEWADYQRTYGCRVINTITGQLTSSSGTAQLIMTTDTEGATANTPHAQQRIVHTQSQVIATDFQVAPTLFNMNKQQQQQVGVKQQVPTVLLPCALLRASSAHMPRWYYASTSGGTPTALETSVNLMHVNAATHQTTNSGGTNSSSSTTHHFNDINFSTTPGSGANYSGSAGSPKSRYLIGAGFLALEWPRHTHSGRYTCEPAPNIRCDIYLIVRRPLRLRATLRVTPTYDLAGVGAHEYALEADSSDGDSSSSPFGDARNERDLVLPSSQARGPTQQSFVSSIYERLFGVSSLLPAVSSLDSTSTSSALSQHTTTTTTTRQQQQIKARGDALVTRVHVARVGQRVEVNCTGSGHPIDSVKWLRNGQQVDAVSMPELEVVTPPSIMTAAVDAGVFSSSSSSAANNNDNAQASNSYATLSTLVVRRVQADDIGLTMFECYAYNALGESARAAIALYVLDQTQRVVSSFDNQRPSTDEGSATYEMLPPNGVSSDDNTPPIDGPAQSTKSGGMNTNQIDQVDQAPPMSDNDISWADASIGSSVGGAATAHEEHERRLAAARRAFQRARPLSTTHAMLGKSLELECPVSSSTVHRHRQQQQQPMIGLNSPAIGSIAIRWRQYQSSAPDAPTSSSSSARSTTSINTW
ncbi:hypothetical protein GZH46_02270, partial [Fragariocoptes setiger]